MSLGNNRASVTWEQWASATWEQLFQCHLGTIVPVSFGNNRGSLTWEQSLQCHLGATVPVSLGNNLTLKNENFKNDFLLIHSVAI